MNKTFSYEDKDNKNKKGFQPLHISWGPYLVDVLFRRGKAHSNHGTDYTDRVSAIVNLIRENYDPDVPIILCSDSGFADQKAFDFFDKINIHFATTSRLYADIREYAQAMLPSQYQELHKDKSIWSFFEFGSKRDSWDCFRRSIFTTRSRDENGQYVLDLSNQKTDSLIYTNIGTNDIADQRLCAAGGKQYLKAGNIVRLSHQRGGDILLEEK